jgi:hypothetical protein
MEFNLFSFGFSVKGYKYFHMDLLSLGLSEDEVRSLFSINYEDGMGITVRLFFFLTLEWDIDDFA